MYERRLLAHLSIDKDLYKKIFGILSEVLYIITNQVFSDRVLACFETFDSDLTFHQHLTISVRWERARGIWRSSFYSFRAEISLSTSGKHKNEYQTYFSYPTVQNLTPFFQRTQTPKIIAKPHQKYHTWHDMTSFKQRSKASYSIFSCVLYGWFYTPQYPVCHWKFLTTKSINISCNWNPLFGMIWNTKCIKKRIWQHR